MTSNSFFPVSKSDVLHVRTISIGEKQLVKYGDTVTGWGKAICNESGEYIHLILLDSL